MSTGTANLQKPEYLAFADFSEEVECMWQAQTCRHPAVWAMKHTCCETEFVYCEYHKRQVVERLASLRPMCSRTHSEYSPPVWRPL